MSDDPAWTKPGSPIMSTTASAVKAQQQAQQEHAEKVHTKTTHRFMGWMSLCFFSIVTLASHVSATWDMGRNKDDWFVLVVCLVTTVTSLLSIFGFIVARQYFAGSIVEGLLAILSLIVWICGMPVIMDPDRNIAVSKAVTSGDSHSGMAIVMTQQTQRGNLTETSTSTTYVPHEFTFIRNANTYFFSWACTISIVYVCGRYARHLLVQRKERQRKAEAAALDTEDTAKNQDDNNNDNDDDDSEGAYVPKTNLWYLLTLASLVVLVDATKLHMSFTCPGYDPDLCLGTQYAVSLGTLGTAFATICSLLATLGQLNLATEFFFALLATAFYICGVGLITFQNGPGTSLGNLYFATWMGAAVSVVVFGRCCHDIVTACQRRRGGPKKLPEPQPLAEDVEISPTVNADLFPDIEMGNSSDKKKKDDENEIDDGATDPDWVEALPPKEEIHQIQQEPKEQVEIELNHDDEPEISVRHFVDQVEQKSSEEEKEIAVAPDDKPASEKSIQSQKSVETADSNKSDKKQSPVGTKTVSKTDSTPNKKRASATTKKASSTASPTTTTTTPPSVATKPKKETTAETPQKKATQPEKDAVEAARAEEEKPASNKSLNDKNKDGDTDKVTTESIKEDPKKKDTPTKVAEPKKKQVDPPAATVTKKMSKNASETSPKRKDAKDETVSEVQASESKEEETASQED